MKTCVITGAASGIGAALVEVFINQGYTVIGIDRDQRRAFELQEKYGQKIDFIIADLSSQASFEDIINKLPSKIDIFIHSAGINAVGAFEQLDIKKQLSVLDVNLKAPIILTRALLEKDMLTKNSSLVFISSLSHFVSYPGAAAYAASKDGLASYARNLSVALKPKRIHVMTVFPGPTRTPHAREHSPDNTRENKRMPPEVLARKIYRGLEHRLYNLVPGFSNKVFAWLGTFLPKLTEAMMKRIIFNKLKNPSK
jgi:short-subunit dehydrogenase